MALLPDHADFLRRPGPAFWGLALAALAAGCPASEPAHETASDTRSP